MATVKVNTSDMEWINRNYADADVVAYGTDIKGVMYFAVTVDVDHVEHVKFAGAAMIRFDLGPNAPRDHNRHAMYPDTYLVGVMMSDDDGFEYATIGEVIRAYTERYGFQDACDAYGEDEVRAAWLPAHDA